MMFSTMSQLIWITSTTDIQVLSFGLSTTRVRTRHDGLLVGYILLKYHFTKYNQLKRALMATVCKMNSSPFIRTTGLSTDSYNKPVRTGRRRMRSWTVVHALYGQSVVARVFGHLQHYRQAGLGFQ